MSRLLVLAAVVAALLLAFPRGVAAQSDDDGNLDVAILDILLERGLIDEAQYDELLALAARAPRRTPPRST
jgi:hypothetical protein